MVWLEAPGVPLVVKTPPNLIPPFVAPTLICLVTFFQLSQPMLLMGLCASYLLWFKYHPAELVMLLDASVPVLMMITRKRLEVDGQSPHKWISVFLIAFRDWTGLITVRDNCPS